MMHWEAMIQDMVEKDAALAKSWLSAYILFLWDAPLPVLQETVITMGRNIRFKHPGVYPMFIKKMNMLYGHFIEEYEKKNHQADIIKFKRQA